MFELSQVTIVWRSAGSRLGPTLVNIFMNIIFLLGPGLHSFEDDTATAVSETNKGLINSLEVKTSNTIKWMKDNDMIANPDKFKLLCLLNLIKIELVLKWN